MLYINSSSSLGTSAFGNTMNLTTPSQGGGNLRIIASTTGNESSVEYYNRNDSRANIAGDVWVSGWGRTGYNIGTPILNSCVNISDAGTITADYKLRTPLLMIDTIRGNGADQVTLDDNLITTCV